MQGDLRLHLGGQKKDWHTCLISGISWALMQGKLRVGLGVETVLAALAHAAYLHKEGPGKEEGRAGRLEAAAQALKRAHSQCPSYDVLVPELLAHPLEVRGGPWSGALPALALQSVLSRGHLAPSCMLVGSQAPAVSVPFNFTICFQPLYCQMFPSPVLSGHQTGKRGDSTLIMMCWQACCAAHPPNSKSPILTCTS